MRIALFGKSLNPEIQGVFREMTDLLLDRRCRITVYEPFARVILKETGFRVSDTTFSTYQELQSQSDMLFSIGGDGTLLDTIMLVRDSNIPILGINLGRLGFLSSVSKNEIYNAIDTVLRKEYKLDERSLLRFESEDNPFGELNFALNEISIHNQGVPSLISMQVYVNDLFLNNYWADGLLVSTPTGSTAYSLSCSGPIVTPQSETFLITPIASHNLTVRPIIIPDNSVIRIRASSREGNFLTGLDSRFETFESDKEFTIRKENFKVNLVDLPGKSFFSTIRDKLKWGLDARSGL